MITPKNSPEDLMLSRLAERTMQGTFEAHVTTTADDAAEQTRFQAVCRALKVKPVLIDLSEGVTPSQPMTSSYHRGTVSQAAGEVAELVRRLRADGFSIVRVKLEAVASNPGVPDTDADANAEPDDCYFEFHVKLKLPADAAEGLLTGICQRHGAKLSRNAFKRSADGVQERFVTQRAYGVGRQTAVARLDSLLADLAAHGFTVINHQKEYSLFDSHVRLDAGWIDAPSGVAT